MIFIFILISFVYMYSIKGNHITKGFYVLKYLVLLLFINFCSFIATLIKD